MMETPSTIAETASPFTFGFVLGRRRITVAVPPHFLGLLLLVSLISYGLGGQAVSAEQRRQAELLQVLKERTQQLERSLAQKQAERDEMEALAESRSEELWGEMQDRDRQLRRLWRLVEPSVGESYSGRSALSSRGGSSTSARAVREKYSQLRAKLTESDAELSKLASAAQKYHRAEQVKLAKSMPSRVPCQGDMTSGFGERYHPIYGGKKLHRGCDFTADYGTKIYATASGKVLTSDWMGGYGQTVEIEHGQGFKTLYAHCAELKVKKGQAVRKGQQIATVGTTGLSSGPHCHYEVHKDGQPIDPKPFLPRRLK